MGLFVLVMGLMPFGHGAFSFRHRAFPLSPSLSASQTSRDSVSFLFSFLLVWLLILTTEYTECRCVAVWRIFLAAKNAEGAKGWGIFFSRVERVDRVERKSKLRVEVEQWRDKSSALELEHRVKCDSARFCVGTKCRFRICERGKSRRL